jgi:hypothetical protein
MPFAITCEKHLVHHGPRVPWSRPTASQLVGIALTELTTAFPDGFICHDHPAGEQAFFDITVAQAEAVIKPHARAYDFRLKSAYRGLSALETAGLITVVRHAGRAPILAILEVSSPTDR